VIFQLTRTETGTVSKPIQLTKTGTENWPSERTGIESGTEITSYRIEEEKELILNKELKLRRKDYTWKQTQGSLQCSLVYILQGYLHKLQDFEFALLIICQEVEGTEWENILN